MSRLATMAAGAVGFGGAGAAIGGSMGGGEGALAGGAAGLGVAAGIATGRGLRGAGRAIRGASSRRWNSFLSGSLPSNAGQVMGGGMARGAVPKSQALVHVPQGSKAMVHVPRPSTAMIKAPNFIRAGDPGFGAGGQIIDVTEASAKASAKGAEKNTGFVAGAKNWATGEGGARFAVNALYGAGTGFVAGGLNPMGNDGMLGGAMSGAVIGGLAGAAAGKMAGGRSGYLGTKGGSGVGLMSNKVGFMFGGKGVGAALRPSMVAGAGAGFVGGSGNSKRHTTIGTNGWSQGTHPAYFGGY